MMTPVPGVTPTKPGSCAKPLPGIFADIVDEEGRPVKKVGAGGYLVIKRPWPSMLRTIWGDNDRYLKTYWEKFDDRYYVAGDSANRDADGYYWIMGRIDDVLNVAGHRLGTMEIESALVAHAQVAEAAVVGKPHDIKGESVFAFVVLNVDRPKAAVAAALVEELRTWVADQLSPIAKPDDIRFADNLPKTRSGKIMRRLLRSIARGEEITQDVSTLENPGILEQLRGVPQTDAKPTTPKPPAPRRQASPMAPGKSLAAKTSARAKKSAGKERKAGPKQKPGPKMKAGLKKKAAAKKGLRAKKAAPIKKGSTKRVKAGRKPRSKK
jgi:hypothetical protein